ncbi:MAG: hypothetical protein C4531_06345 [Desulfurivibrio sp.]|nr:MAG: hypothetical protein C4531_06345 [Desulfurivibrio sp.]
MLIAQVANFFGQGVDRTNYEDGSWSRNVIPLKLGRYRVKITQNDLVMSNRAKAEGFVHTSEIKIERVRSFEEGKRVMEDLCRLLSLAAISQVRPFSYEYSNRQNSYSVSGQSMFWRPLLDIQNGEAVQSFVEQVWPRFRKLKRSRKLPEVIEMLTVAELPFQPLEVKLAQVFIILENLKGTFARSNNIPFAKGFFRGISFPPKANPAKEKPLGFEQLLKNMLGEVGMKPSLRRVVGLRNEIIHFGLSRKTYESLFKHYETCQDLIREYLLRLLGYHGRYWIYSKACREQGLL